LFFFFSDTRIGKIKDGVVWYSRVLCFGAPIDVRLDLTPCSLRPEIQFQLYTPLLLFVLFFFFLVLRSLALLDFAIYKCIFGPHFAFLFFFSLFLSSFSFPLRMEFFDHDATFLHAPGFGLYVKYVPPRS